MSKYTKEELIKFKEEIEIYQKRKHLFAGLGWLCIGLSVLFLILFGTVGLNSKDESPFAYLSSFLFGGGIVLFILRSAIFNTKIRNRRRIIRKEIEDREFEKLIDNK